LRVPFLRKGLSGFHEERFNGGDVKIVEEFFMIEKLLGIIFLCIICGIIIFIAVQKIIKEGVNDEVNFPLSSCDTSMYDEIKCEGEKQK
jgi:hypothetical protein